MQPDAELLGERLQPLERRRLLLDLELGEEPVGLEFHDGGVFGRLYIDGAPGGSRLAISMLGATEQASSMRPRRRDCSFLE